MSRRSGGFGIPRLYQSIGNVQVAITISLWFYISHTANDSIFFSMWRDTGSGLNRIVLQGRADGTLSVRHTDEHGVDGDANGSSYSSNTWTHFIGRFAGITARLAYKDGVQFATDGTTVTNAQFNRVDIFNMDGEFGNNANNCRIAEVGVWNTTLWGGEHRALAAGLSPKGIRPDSLIHHYELLDEDGDRDWVTGVALTKAGLVADLDHPSAMVYPSSCIVV